MQLTFATRNKGKFKEAKALLDPLGYQLQQFAKGYPEVQADSLADVALFAAEALPDRLSPPFFLDDAGLFVNALGGFPGVYSAYAYKTLGHRGLLRLLEGKKARAAHFEAIIAFHDGSAVHLFRGVTRGTMTKRARGTRGFGFDPVFVPDGHRKTFAQMTLKEKNAVSHRGRALAAFTNWLPGNPS